MGKVIRLTESDLEKIVQKVIEEQETQEGLGDVYQGLKGVWRGYGYDYYKYYSMLRTLTRKLKKLDEPNTKIMTQLSDLKDKVQSSKMPAQSKFDLENTIEEAVNYFSSYASAIDRIEKLSSQTLK
jgi:hypothetical protein